MEKFDDLVGKVLSKIDQNDDKDELIFTLDCGERYKLWHMQDCCESVTIEDISGDLDDLVGIPILLAEESTNTKNPPEGYDQDGSKDWYGETFTWTFYKISTNKGSVTIRWFGTSNGYYSESVDFDKVL